MIAVLLPRLSNEQFHGAAMAQPFRKPSGLWVSLFGGQAQYI